MKTTTDLQQFSQAANQLEQLILEQLIEDEVPAKSVIDGTVIYQNTKDNKNYKAAFLCTEALSFTQAFAMNNLGIFYYKGIGVERNFEKAVECFEKAAAMGHKVAAFNLGFCYERGEGVTKDLKKALEHFRKALTKDFHLVRLHLSLYYALGLAGIKQDPEMAKEFLLTARALQQPSISLNSKNNNNSTNISFTMLWQEDADHNVSENVRNRSTASYSLVDLRYYTIFVNPESNNFFIQTFNELPPIYKTAFEGDLKAFSECLSNIRSLLYETDMKYYMEKHSIASKSQAIRDLMIGNATPLIINGITPLIMAVLGNSREIIKELCRMGFDPHRGFYPDPKVGPMSSIHLAALSGNNLTLNLLVSEKIDLNHRLLKESIGYRLTPLTSAAMGGDDGECAEILLSLGADINEFNARGHTALMDAICCRNHAMTQFLCDKGADLSLQIGGNGDSAISIACKLNNIPGVEIITEVERCTFPLVHENDVIVSVLGIAIERNHVKVVKTIINSKAFLSKPNFVAKYELRPSKKALDSLTLAIEMGHSEIVELLVKHFDLKGPNEQGRTPLHTLIYAMPNNFLHILSFILNRENYQIKDKQGFTPLMRCIIKREEIELLGKNRPKRMSLLELQEKFKVDNTLTDDPKARAIIDLNGIATQIVMKMTTRYLAECVATTAIKRENFNFYECERQIFRLVDKLCIYMVLSHKNAQGVPVIPLDEFPDSVIPKSIKRLIKRHIVMSETLLKRVVELMILITTYKEKPILPQPLLSEAAVVSRFMSSPAMKDQEFFEIIWNCSDEKMFFERKGFEKKILDEQRLLKTAIQEIESDLLWLPTKVSKYLDESLKLAKSRDAVKDVLENIKLLSKAPMADPKFGVLKLQAAESLVAEISKVSENLLQQQIRFTSKHQKLKPKIKSCLESSDLKQAKKLIGHLHKIRSMIENLGESFKQAFKNLKNIEEALKDKLSHEKARSLLLQKRQDEKANKEKSYLQQCLDKLINAEERLATLQKAMEVRAKEDAQRRLEFQSRLVKQKQQRTESLLAQKEMKQEKEREADKMMTFSLKDNGKDNGMNNGKDKERNGRKRRKPTKNIKLCEYLVQPQFKLKARSELIKLSELLQSLSFENNNLLALDLAHDNSAEIFGKMQRFAIIGIVARAMECYKNIKVHLSTDGAHSKNTNIFKEYARIFRDAAFHCLEETLFKKIGDNPKKNMESNQPFIDMACKMLTFLNDPKWKKQAITKQDILQAFSGKSPDNDLFTRIIKMVIKPSSPQECKNQILQGKRDLRDFEALKEQVPDLLYQAAIGFCYARIGCFAAELIKYKNSNTVEGRAYRAVNYELRREYKIPLGKYIQLGIGFRHVLVHGTPNPNAGRNHDITEGSCGTTEGIRETGSRDCTEGSSLDTGTLKATALGPIMLTPTMLTMPDFEIEDVHQHKSRGSKLKL